MLGKYFATELFISLSSKATLNFISIYSYFMTTKSMLFCYFYIYIVSLEVIYSVY